MKKIRSDKLKKFLLYFASIPLIIIMIVPIIVLLIIDSYKNRMKKKSKALLSKGFTLTKEKQNKKTIYMLSKENIIIRICEYDFYEISIDHGLSFQSINESVLFSAADKMEFDRIIHEYKSCDYRDEDIYEPTVKIARIISNYFS
ncbi:MAG: hypothetical protein IKZ25_05310 [Clostridia bacterium]|nr:hypothetical protein [Clostridia bacterium]